MAKALPLIEQALRVEGLDPDAADDPVGLGIGIHTGLACVGNMGSTLRFDYSIVGDAVNTAARIEPLTKTYGMPVLVSEDVVAEARGFAFVPVDTLRLKGQARRTRVFALLGTLEEMPSDLGAFLSAHERALALVSARAPEAADALAAARRFGVLSAMMATTYGVWEQRLSRRVDRRVAGVAG